MARTRIPELPASRLQFRVEIPQLSASELLVQLRVSLAAVERKGTDLQLFLPTWTPGSYLIREFARHVVQVRAHGDDDQPLPCTKVGKNRWSVQPGPGSQTVTVQYLVYCHELTVRTADVTPHHAFWNHACVLMWPVDNRHLGADIVVRIPGEWDLVSSLLPAPSPARPADTWREIELHARDMERAYDCPVLAGKLDRLDWSSLGIPHTLALTGFGAIPIPAQLAGDADRIVRTAAAMFGAKLPYERYLFLCLATTDGGGGLEHSDSTALLHPRSQLHTRKGYLDLLSLIAHEHFHCWNVKRMRPLEFVELDYEAEAISEFLWLAEGWTAYYDDLLCLRAGVSNPSEYLASVARNLQAMLGNPGRFRTSLADSSRDAWIRLYRPDENTRNSSQNYYGNGAVLALCLDLLIRRDSQGRHSLDDVIRTLFDEHPSYRREDVLALVARFGGEAAIKLLISGIDGVLDPPVESLLRDHGVALVVKDTEAPYLGVQFESGTTVLASVTRNAPAWECGLMPGDEILALQSLRVDAGRWTDLFLSVARPGSTIDVLLSRRGMIHNLAVRVGKNPGSVSVEPAANATEDALALRSKWLGESNSRSPAA